MKWKEKAVSSANAASATAAGWLKFLLLLSLVTWSAYSHWQLHQARVAGAAVRDALVGKPLAARDSPTVNEPAVLTAVEHLGAGQFAEAARLLAPAGDLTPAQQDAARRFLVRHSPLRQRLIAAAAAAEKRQQDGGEAGAARAELARVLAAAARGELPEVEAGLEAAEAALDRVSAARGGQAWPAGEAGVAARAAALEPAVRMGRELLTEGFAAAGPLIGRAAWECRRARYDDAASALDLAAALLGIAAQPNGVRAVPAWFLDLAQAPPATVETVHARAAVELAEAVAQADAVPPAVASLVARARREFDAGQVAEADWWASVALAALAMDPAAVAAAEAGEADEHAEDKPEP